MGKKRMIIISIIFIIGTILLVKGLIGLEIDKNKDKAEKELELSSDKSLVMLTITKGIRV